MILLCEMGPAEVGLGEALSSWWPTKDGRVAEPYDCARCMMDDLLDPIPGPGNYCEEGWEFQAGSRYVVMMHKGQLRYVVEPHLVGPVHTRHEHHKAMKSEVKLTDSTSSSLKSKVNFSEAELARQGEVGFRLQ